MDTSSVQSFWQNNQHNTFSAEHIMPFSNQFLPELLISPISNYSGHDENTDKTSDKYFQVLQ